MLVATLPSGRLSPARHRHVVFIVCALVMAAFAPSLFAANPLNLTPGVATTLTLGSIQTLAKFNTSTGSSDISYSNSDLTTRTYVVRLPSGFDANDATKKYGLITYIDAGSPHSFPPSYAAALDAHDIIWIGGNGIDNTQAVTLRRGVAIMGAFRISELYPIDPARIYASGVSGGSRTASDLAYLRSDYFHGFIGRVGSSIPAAIPGWQTAGTNSNVGNFDADYEYMSVYSTEPSVVLPIYFRTALMTQYGDFRRSEQMAVYRYGHLNHGNTARVIVRPGGHSTEVGDSFTNAIDFLYHPLVDIIWDRFENGNLAANTESGKTVAGTGFTAISGSVSETSYTYNGSALGVLKLTGDGAAVRANDTFGWQSDTGILVDARLRAENATTAGQNQRIGLHIVPVTATGATANQPGFHLYWNYGQPYAAEIVSIDGVRKTLATWEHTATHPMNLATTVTSPQAGEGIVQEKTFWSDTAAPDYAGRTKAFRGEDVRLVLNSGGFQLTFNRPAVNLVTSYPGVVTATTDTVTTNPNETFPIVLQGFWSDVETALVNALPTGNWQLVLTNDALTPGQAVGNAVVDEIRLIGSTGSQAAPVLTVTAPANTTRTLSWLRIHGAMGYVIQRSSSPDGPFAALTTPANTASTYTDTVAQNVAYYYRVAAIGSDGATGTWSEIGFAARNVAVPAAPTAASVTYPATYQASLAWTDNATTETGYRVERSPAGREQWSLVTGSLAANAIVYTDTTVTPGTSYDYRISAVGTGGLSAYARVTACVPTLLQSWRQTYFGTTDNAGNAADTADYDGDGASNLMEYALETDPASSTSVGVPTSSMANLRLQLTFKRARSDVTYIVEASSDLVTWTTVETNPGTLGQYVTVADTMDLPAATPPRRFLRLKVTAP